MYIAWLELCIFLELYPRLLPEPAWHIELVVRDQLQFPAQAWPLKTRFLELDRRHWLIYTLKYFRPTRVVGSLNDYPNVLMRINKTHDLSIELQGTFSASRPLSFRSFRIWRYRKHSGIPRTVLSAKGAADGLAWNHHLVITRSDSDSGQP